MGVSAAGNPGRAVGTRCAITGAVPLSAWRVGRGGDRAVLRSGSARALALPCLPQCARVRGIAAAGGLRRCSLRPGRAGASLPAPARGRGGASPGDGDRASLVQVAVAASPPPPTAEVEEAKAARVAAELGTDPPDPADSPEPAPPLGVILRHLGSLLREDAWLLTTAVAYLVAAAGAELTVPGLVGECIFAASSCGSDGGALLRWRIAHLLAAATALGLAARNRSVAFCTLNARLLERLRTRVFAAIIEQPVGWFDGVETGQLTSRLGADSASVSRFVATSANVALRSGLQCIGAAVALAWLCPPMAAACVSVAIVQAGLTIVCGEYLRVTQRAYQDGLAHSSGVAEESFLLSRIIRTFGTERDATGSYAKTLRVLTRIYTQQGHVYSATLGLNLWLSQAMRVVALLCGARAVLRGQLDARRLTAFMLYVDTFASGAHQAAEQFGPVMESLGASERVVAFLSKKPAPQLSAGVRPERLCGDIEFRDVTFEYPARPGQPALRGVSLKIPAGKRVAIVGLSGSGKSSLVALLQRLYDPTSGSVLVDGTDLRSLDAAWYRERLGVVGQDPRLFSIPVGANIAYGCPSATRADVVAAARAANAAGFIDALPMGYDTPVTDRLLSGGQKQRVAIARALVREPSMLLLDEATSALDSESEAAVQAALDRAMLVSGRTVVVIAHRLSTVRNADLTVVMASGRVAELGTHDELLALDGIYAALVRRQEGKVVEKDNDLAPTRPRRGEDAARTTVDAANDEAAFSEPQPSQG